MRTLSPERSEGDNRIRRDKIFRRTSAVRDFIARRDRSAH